MIINDDILHWCKEQEWEETRFHAVLCDPPYELGFMGKSWDSTGIAFDPATWKAIGNVLYPGSYLLAFGGTRTFHRIAVAIEDAGFEIRDTVMWVYGSGFPKSHNLGKAVDKKEGNEREDLGEHPNPGTAGKTFTRDGGAFRDGIRITKGTSPWEGYGTALKPSWEPIIIARKPLEGTVAQNALKYGSGALNIDGCRVGTGSDKTDGGTHGAIFGNGISSPVDKSIGRWPANLIHDGSDEVVRMFPKAGNGWKKNYGEEDYKGRQYGGGSFGGGGYKGGSTYADSGSAARFFYSAKVSKRERDAGLEGFEERADTAKGNGLARICETCGAPQLKPELCECEVKSWVLPKTRNHHPTVKPISLTTYLAKLILPPKLDQARRLLVPFAGSGSEVIGGFKAGWDEVVGVEKEKEYAEIAEARINHHIKR